jgi:ribonuclease BN (tRNA processing enzyme)
VELEHEGWRILLDAGTGIQAMGQTLRGQPLSAAILFSHVHWDHIQGFPFFGPLFHPDSSLTMVGACRASGTVRDALDAQMKPPRWPVGLDVFPARLRFVDLRGPMTWSYGPFRVRAVDLEHPNGVVAWQITAGGRSLVYATDVEHGATLDRRLVELSTGADLLIHDAQYTVAEYRGEGGLARRGWGHSTVLDAAQVAQHADVRRLALFHHDPTRSDEAVCVMEQQAQQHFPASFAARQGMQLVL